MRTVHTPSPVWTSNCSFRAFSLLLGLRPTMTSVFWSFCFLMFCFSNHLWLAPARVSQITRGDASWLKTKKICCGQRRLGNPIFLFRQICGRPKLWTIPPKHPTKSQTQIEFVFFSWCTTYILSTWISPSPTVVQEIQNPQICTYSDTSLIWRRYLGLSRWALVQESLLKGNNRAESRRRNSNKGRGWSEVDTG